MKKDKDWLDYCQRRDKLEKKTLEEEINGKPSKKE